MTREFPVDLQELLTKGILRKVSEDEFSIDALSHRQRTWLGWTDVRYTLRIEEDDEGESVFDIVEETCELGEDVVVSSTDADEVACWITAALEEKAE